LIEKIELRMIAPVIMSFFIIVSPLCWFLKICFQLFVLDKNQNFYQAFSTFNTVSTFNTFNTVNTAFQYFALIYRRVILAFMRLSVSPSSGPVHQR